MIEYRGYIIEKVCGYYEIKNPQGKWFRNAVTVEDAKEKIDIVENSRR